MQYVQFFSTFRSKDAGLNRRLGKAMHKLYRDASARVSGFIEKLGLVPQFSPQPVPIPVRANGKNARQLRRRQVD